MSSPEKLHLKITIIIIIIIINVGNYMSDKGIMKVTQRCAKRREVIEATPTFSTGSVVTQCIRDFTMMSNTRLQVI